jgi:hypothetical protein
MHAGHIIPKIYLTPELTHSLVPLYLVSGIYIEKEYTLDKVDLSISHKIVSIDLMNDFGTINVLQTSAVMENR